MSAHAVPHFQSVTSRRDFLCRTGGGFGAIALAGLLASEQKPALGATTPPLRPHVLGKAKSVIFLFMDGGPSHLDTFDPKPLVNEFAGKPLPPSIKRVITPMGVSENGLLASRRKWKLCGESRLPVSDWYPLVGDFADDPPQDRNTSGRKSGEIDDFNCFVHESLLLRR